MDNTVVIHDDRAVFFCKREAFSKVLDHLGIDFYISILLDFRVIMMDERSYIKPDKVIEAVNFVGMKLITLEELVIQNGSGE
jgi:hypothetical protein